MTEVKKQLIDKLIFDQEGFRMSTPLPIAEYKAERLKADSIADLGSGVGVQSLCFAKRSHRVLVVENNSKRMEYCRKNAEIMGLTNIEFIVGNATDLAIANKIGSVDIVHSDPSRQKTGDRWSFSDLSPDPFAILKLYRVENLSFDLPALMRRELVPDQWELEYISLQGELKRLSTYVGGIKKFDRSAVTLPSGSRIILNRNLSRKVEQVEKPMKWLYDLDGSVYQSGLLPEFLLINRELRLLQQDRQRTILTGEKFLKNPFIIRSYSMIDFATTVADLKRKLGKLRAGRVIPRYSTDSSKYYEERRSIGKGLEGDKTVYLFNFKGRYYLAERIREKLAEE